jgi:hypothetical protein
MVIKIVKPSYGALSLRLTLYASVNISIQL